MEMGERTENSAGSRRGGGGGWNAGWGPSDKLPTLPPDLSRCAQTGEG